MANLNDNKIKFDNAFIVVENAGEKTDSNGNVDQYTFDGEDENGTDCQKKTVRFLKKYEGKYIAPTVTFGNKIEKESETKNRHVEKKPAKSKTIYGFTGTKSDFYCNDLVSYVYDSDGQIKAYNITKAALLMKAIEDYNKANGN